MPMPRDDNSESKEDVEMDTESNHLSLIDMFMGSFFLTENKNNAEQLIDALRNPANQDLLNSITANNGFGIDSIHITEITLEEFSSCLINLNLKQMKLDYVYPEGVMIEELLD